MKANAALLVGVLVLLGGCLGGIGGGVTDDAPDDAVQGTTTTTTDETSPETSPETTTARTTTTTTTAVPATTTLPATTDVDQWVNGTFVIEGGENVTVTLRVADESDERTRGLMYRQSLANRSGMVFVYDDASSRTFWMKNTYVDLDIIYVAANGTVLNVEHAQAQPHAPSSEVDRYSSDGQAKYVVELPRGFANETGVESGTEFVFDGAVPEAGPGTVTTTSDDE